MLIGTHPTDSQCRNTIRDWFRNGSRSRKLTTLTDSEAVKLARIRAGISGASAVAALNWVSYGETSDAPASASGQGVPSGYPRYELATRPQIARKQWGSDHRCRLEGLC